MGRMLETMKLANGQRPAASAPQPAEAPASGVECVVDWTVNDGGAAPFIEVGGPGQAMEASADVLAVPGPPRPPGPSPPVPPAEIKKTIASKPAVLLTAVPPMTVAFQPWPRGGLASRGIVSDVIAHHQPDHPVSKQYGVLLQQILEGQSGVDSLLFTGVQPGVGTTTVLLNLAVAGATHLKRQVAVVDANWRHPTIAERLGFQVSAGILEVLAGGEALEHVLLSGPIAGLHVLPATPAQGAQLTPEGAAWLLAWLRDKFDFILIDGPTLEDAANLAVWLSCCQAVYAVAPHQEGAGPKALAHAIARMGGRLRGMIHTHLA